MFPKTDYMPVCNTCLNILQRTEIIWNMVTDKMIVEIMTLSYLAEKKISKDTSEEPISLRKIKRQNINMLKEL